MNSGVCKRRSPNGKSLCSAFRVRAVEACHPDPSVLAQSKRFDCYSSNSYPDLSHSCLFSSDRGKFLLLLAPVSHGFRCKRWAYDAIFAPDNRW